MSKNGNDFINAHIPPGGVKMGLPLSDDGSINYFVIAMVPFIQEFPTGEWQTLEANINGERCFFMVKAIGGGQFEVAQSCLSNTFAARIFQAMDEIAPGRVLIGED